VAIVVRPIVFVSLIVRSGDQSKLLPASSETQDTQAKDWEV
jgi:hypothetical protein